MNPSTPPTTTITGIMDPTDMALSDMNALFKPMETDLFQELYLSMTNNPGLMTPMDDWHSLDLLDANNMVNDSPSIQDLFLTSPSSIHDANMLTPSSSPEVLFNSLMDMSSPPSTTLSDIISSEPSILPSPSSPQETAILNDHNNNAIKKNNKKVITTPSPTSPLEMMLTLDTPLKLTSPSSATTKISKDKSKKKVTPPAASLPVTSHIMSASTPTFTLKQTNGNGNNKKRTYSASSSSTSSSSSPTSKTISTKIPVTTPLISSSTDINADVSTELALKRQRNTDAARRSRLRKVQKMETLSSRVSELESIHQQLLIRLATLETDKSILLKNEATYQSRIEQLESELTDAHVKLAQL
ncbi:hypothetical protein BJ944DRAFT_95150 [Cunninghamella echinulata]|nr:hypothetical protein BJ944DRAFT_95150 [Cunninghamella echinulata]